MIYRFGDCELDTKLLELRRAGAARALDPLEFDLLTYLIENRDRVLTRDELLDALWPGKVVTDSALSSRLKSVRSAVGDSGAAQRIIKTVHGRGYRFIADLADVPETPSTAPVPSSTDRFVARTAAVGRDVELGKLARWLDRVRAGERAIVLICGDAGVGKTTLTRSFLATAVEQAEVFVMHGQCVNQRGASEAYLPLLEALGRAGQQNPIVAEALRQHAPAWLSQLPSLARVDTRTLEQPPVGVTAGRMLRELSDMLISLARTTTTVLVLEDLHWSDPSTIDWLEYHARRNDSTPLLLIATFRPEGSFQAVGRELAIRGYAYSLQLDAIEEAFVSDYLDQRLDRPAAPELAALAFRRTGGFPLFLDTLVDHWLENGLVRRSDGMWSAADAEAALVAGVPESLSELIDQQLANLRDAERRLLETAALAGSPFAAAAVAHALDDAQETIEALLARLARQGRIVRTSGEVRWPDGTVTATFEFRHELYREALYTRVGAARRARLHRALGERLESAYRDDPSPVAGEIADHFARAHEVSRAIKYFYPAALLAFNRSAYRETVAILNRALALMGTLPESPDTQRIERDLQLLRGSALISLEGWAFQGVEDAYLRARELGEKLGLNGTTPEILGLAAMYENRGRYAQSQAVIESLLEHRAELGLEAHELLACSLFHQGRFDLSRSNADRAIEEYDPDEVSAILARYGENPGVSCHSWAALDLWFLGYPDSAVQRSDKALELANGHVYSRCSALTLRTFLHQFRNEPQDTLTWADRALEVAEQQGFYYRVAQVMILAGWARGLLASESGVQQAALAAIEEGIRRHAELGSEMDLPYHLTLKAELLAHMGRSAEALAAIGEAIEANPRGRDFFYEAEMYRLHGLLLLHDDPQARQRTEALLAQSLRVAQRQGARLLELRTCLSRCELANGSNPTESSELQDLLDALQEGSNTPDVKAARACALGRAQHQRTGTRATMPAPDRPLNR